MGSFTEKQQNAMVTKRGELTQVALRDKRGKEREELVLKI
jgi:hypothetical protein